jgi:hypothetical protein
MFTHRRVCNGTMEKKHELTFKEFCSRGGKALRGTETAKEKARKAVNARWAKERAKKEVK